MIPRDFSCPYGLACRVATIANGLSYASNIITRWIINEHCPAPWDKVFPNGIPGVEFVATKEKFLTAFTAPGVFAHQWKAAADRGKANAAFARIMGAMAGKASKNPHPVAILGRFHTNPHGCPYKLADTAIDQAAKIGATKVFILSDKFRFEIAQRLAHGGIRAVLPFCQPLPVDLARTEKDLFDYIVDWKSVLAAKVIVALDGPASALHPARAAGAAIHYVSG